MACFVVSGGEAIVASAVRAAVKKRELEAGIIDEQGKQLSDPAQEGFCWTRKLNWLLTMLWGGVVLLAIEHIWHGELVLYPPFLTAMYNPADTAEMLREMATVGVGMAVLVTLAWFVLTLVADAVVKHSVEAAPEKA